MGINFNWSWWICIRHRRHGSQWTTSGYSCSASQDLCHLVGSLYTMCYIESLFFHFLNTQKWLMLLVCFKLLYCFILQILLLWKGFLLILMNSEPIISWLGPPLRIRRKGLGIAMKTRLRKVVCQSLLANQIDTSWVSANQRLRWKHQFENPLKTVR